jgi:carotenoid cleavage dioxygenase-like enzyme
MENKLGRQYEIRLGELNCASGLFKSSLLDIMKMTGFLPSDNEFQKYTANTAITHHAKKTYALCEPDLPFNVQIETQPDDSLNFDIKSIGFDDFNGQLKHNASAHSKINKKTGELFVFGADMKRPICSYTLINKERKVTTSL